METRKQRVGRHFSKTFLELFHRFLSLFLSKTTGKVPARRPTIPLSLWGRRSRPERLRAHSQGLWGVLPSIG